MFKHKKKSASNSKANSEKEEATDLKSSAQPEEQLEVAEKIDKSELKKTTSSATELMEKNLKWSQIIYEQNRKINSKLFWLSVAGWLRLLIVVVPIILAIIYLPPVFKELFSSYRSILGGSDTGAVGAMPSPESIERIFKLLPLDESTKDQLKGVLQ